MANKKEIKITSLDILRDIRDELSLNLKDLNFKEQKAYIKKQLAKLKKARKLQS
jgi:hypothetical protein